VNVDECVSETLASSGELDGLWDSIIVPLNVKGELLYHTALSLAVRPRLPFTVTALHGLLLLTDHQGPARRPWRGAWRSSWRRSTAATCGCSMSIPTA